MKNKNHLKSLIQNLVKEAVTTKIGEGQPIGGVKNDHEFDAGRYNVMKAVNIGENDDEGKCDCGSGQEADWEMDGQGIPLVKACPKCRQEKLKRYRPEILRPYTQADVDEPIEPDEYEESVGFDGKYVDDMESGVAVKKLHGLDENTNQQGIAVLRDFTRFLLQQLGIKDQSYAVAAEKVIPSFMPKFEKYFPHGQNEGVIKENNEAEIGKNAYKIAVSLFGKNNIQSVTPTTQVSPEISTFLVLMKPKREGFPGDKTYIRYLSDTNKWEKWDGKNYSAVLKESVLGFAAGAAVGATATIAYRFIKDLIKHLLTNKSLDINSPLTEKKIDMFMALAKKQNPKLKDEDIELVRNAFNTALKNGSIKTVGDMMTFGKDAFTENLEGDAATPWKEIDNGFYMVGDSLAKKLAGGQLPKAGYEKLVKAPPGFPTKKGFIWLTQTALHSKPVWSIRDSGSWTLENGQAILSSDNLSEETGTGAVAGYATPYAFSKKKEGSSRAIASAKKYGTVVKSISEKK